MVKVSNIPFFPSFSSYTDILQCSQPCLLPPVDPKPFRCPQVNPSLSGKPTDHIKVGEAQWQNENFQGKYSGTARTSKGFFWSKLCPESVCDVVGGGIFFFNFEQQTQEISHLHLTHRWKIHSGHDSLRMDVVGAVVIDIHEWGQSLGKT